ncbi:GrpB domain-containingprotein [Purpureocillium lavendulum]|uniref:GrpB domain-containingprotein n=1 Tax=Purpureocillium lavendulum TaxID=1247861 RepID=A0AB34G674_9HYPO|nr:GrpB domain-containingprotein [Purpureocillium lavendulum]
MVPQMSTSAAGGPAPPPPPAPAPDDPHPPPPASSSLTPPQASALLSSFASFLTVALHTLLRHRALYPPETFLLAAAYGLPIYQSRHPDVCAWVRDAVAAAALQLRRGAVRSLALVVHEPRRLRVVERWVFDLAGFPREDLDGDDDDGRGGGGGGVGGGGGGKGKGKSLAAVERRRKKRMMTYGGWDDDDEAMRAVNWTDVNEALRGALRRIVYAAETKPPPPDGSTFTLAIELRDEAPAPIELWIPSQPDLQPPTPSNPSTGSALGGASTTPIRAVQAGPLFFECWYEEGKEDDATAAMAASTQDSDAMEDETQSSMYQ